MRHRLGRFASDFKETHVIVARIERETGARVPVIGGYSLDSFFRKAALRDVLDGITHVYQALLQEADKRGRYPSDAYTLRQAAREWRDFVARVLAEEHTTYEVDSDCNVRYAVDEAYALNRKATLNGLDAARWASVKGEFERAFDAMDGTEQDTNAAIRAIAAAVVEACGKIVIGNGASRFGSSEIQKYLSPLVRAMYASDNVAADASQQIVGSLSDWTNATHQYRHGQGVGVEVTAPVSLAVQMLTSGAAFIRWMIEIDTARQPA
ncbi:hypothetical protein GCM10025759_06770 [Lysobacter panacisoli]|uniref:Abortive infection protein-like C-terminal domain-containing protein n=2 Tax=Lysobacter panacisoli TaxID=1255263 RepID=A0ABP9L298_9GAMM